MESNVYNDVVVVVSDNGNVVLVNNESVIKLPVPAVEYIADCSKFAKEVRKDLSDSATEVHRLRGGISKLKVQLKEALDELHIVRRDCELNRTDAANLNAKNNDLEAKNKDLEAECTRLKAELKNAKSGNVEPQIAIIGHVVKQVNSVLYDVDNNIICDCTLIKIATRASNMLKNGEISVEQVKKLFNDVF